MGEAELLAAVTRGRGRDSFVARAEAQGLADQPTRVLALAGRLVHDPDTLGEGLVALMDAAEVRWRPETPVDGPGFDAQRMVLADPAGGSYEVLREMPAFTPAEYARAQALVEVAAALLRRAGQTTLLLPDGSELVIRAAIADDLEGVQRLHERSSAATRQRRYPGGVRTPSEARLRRLLDPDDGLTLLAVHDDRLVAMANLIVEGDLGEVALMVQDDWQRRGIGTALLRRLTAYAEGTGLAALVAHTGADNAAMLRTLRRFGADGGERDGAMLSVTLPVTGRQHTETPVPRR
jgi:GNAT superfamily N-acetyltransferase